MNIQKRVYKFNATRQEVLSRVKEISNTTTLEGKWVDGNNFCLWQRNLPFLKLNGNITELEESNKLGITIAADKKYLLLFTFPAAIIIYGCYKEFLISQNGWFLIFGGISLTIFIYLIASAISDGLKKKFKEAFRIM